MTHESSISPRPSSFKTSTLTFGPETRYFYTLHAPDLSQSQVWYIWVPIPGNISAVDALNLMADCVSNIKDVDKSLLSVYTRDKSGGIWVEYFTSPRTRSPEVMLRLFSDLKEKAERFKQGGQLELGTGPSVALEGSSSSGDSAEAHESRPERRWRCR